jgi:hypothetical protein
MKRFSRPLAGIFLVLLAILFADAAADMWPAVGVQADACAQAQTMTAEDRDRFLQAVKKAHKIACEFRDVPVTRVNVEGMRMALSPDQALLALVALFGGLGGVLRSLFSLFGIEPGVSSGRRSLTLVIYVVLRALFLPSGAVWSVNPYGFLAIAALAGLFAESVLGRAGLATTGR